MSSEVSEFRRKSSFSAEELTPIVLNQLQTANKLKESRRQRRQFQENSNNSAANNGHTADSGSESCGEEHKQRAAEAFMSGIQSALSSQQQQQQRQHQQNDKHQEGLSRELVSEVDLVLSKLMQHSVQQRGDPKLVPLIASLQASLRATAANHDDIDNNDDEAVKDKDKSGDTPEKKNRLTLAHQSKSSSLTSDPASPRTPSTPGSAGTGGKDWTRDPFGSLPRRPQAIASGQDFGPRHAKTFNPRQAAARGSNKQEDPVPLSEFSRLGADLDVDEDLPQQSGSKIPWKIRASRKRAKHHTTGMTKDEFAKIKQSLQESAAKFMPRSGTNQDSSQGVVVQRRNHSGGGGTSSSHTKAKIGEQEQLLYEENHRSTDLGYASDVCDYNLPPSDDSNTLGEKCDNRESEDPRSNSLSVHQDISYIQQRRPPSMVSPNLKPLDPSMEISLFDRRRQIIEKRASVFLGDSDSRDTVSISDFDSKAVHDTGVRTNTKALKDSRDKAAKSVEEETYLENRIPYRQSVTTRQSSESPPKLDECEDEVQTMQPPNILVSTTIALDGGNCGLERDFMENKELQTEGKQSHNDHQQRLLSVPEDPGRLSQQSSVEEDENGGRKSKKNSRSASNSAVRAKINRRKMMRHANAIDNPMGSLSDQENEALNSIDDDDEDMGRDSIEEKQDIEPINEKGASRTENPIINIDDNASSTSQQLQQQQTPEASRKNWSSRFSNIKSSFDVAAPPEEEVVAKARSPSSGKTHHVDFSMVIDRGRDTERGRMKARDGRSRSAHSIKSNETASTKDDKNKANSDLTSATLSDKSGYISDNPATQKHQQSSGRDSADYHQYLEMIERFRDNNPKAYSRPLQKNVPVVQSSLVPRMQPYAQHPQPFQQQRQTKSQPREQQYNDRLAAKAEIMGLVKSTKKPENHDMDYQEYMNIINKVRRTKEFTRVRTEQIRLASMYAQEKKRQEELKLEEERLRKEREQYEKEKEQEGRTTGTSDNAIPPLQNAQYKERDNNQAEQQSQLANNESSLLPASSEVPEIEVESPTQRKINRVDSQEEIRLEHARLERIRQEQLEQQRQQELRELQVKAEQEKLVKLREEQVRQEKEREEIRRLEQERLQQIQEEQQRLEFEKMRQEHNIRQEQQRLEEERKRQERLQAEKNAQYNRQRLDMEAQNLAMNEGKRFITNQKQYVSPEQLNPEEKLLRERLLQREKLREEHRREEAQIRKEKLNLIRQEETLISRQEEMLKQIEEERLNLAKQEDLIKSRQAGRLNQVRQEKHILEKQEEMLKVREQQLEQERLRQEKLREEQRALREQEEAIKKRQEEIKELLLSDLSDTGSESITMCHPREGQVFMGKKPLHMHFPHFTENSAHILPASQSQISFDKNENKSTASIAESSNEPLADDDIEDSDERTLDDGDEEQEDYYETKVEVTQNPTSVPTSVRTIETKIDNPPWAPITPYLNLENNDEIVSQLMLRGVKPSSYTKTGVITSPESVRTSSANLITTPDSLSLQSQTSRNESSLSVGSSCPGSPPPVPPLPIDKKPSLTSSQLQPNIPPREDSLSVAINYSASQDMIPSSIISGRDGTSASQDFNMDRHSPVIGGPGSAFKPYASSENLYDPSLFGKSRSPDRPLPPIVPPNFPMAHAAAVRNGSLDSERHGRGPVYSKIRELRHQQQLPPFSTTDTEPEMKECKMPPLDARGNKRGKAKMPTYSTSETEEEYQAYLRMRPRWHGKGGHKNSWDPLLIDSPPQITQKPVGIIQRPKAQPAPIAVERGTQIGATPVFVPPGNVPAQQQSLEVIDRDGVKKSPQVEYERIQKSDSIIEMNKAETQQQKKFEIHHVREEQPDDLEQQKRFLQEQQRVQHEKMLEEQKLREERLQEQKRLEEERILQDKMLQLERLDEERRLQQMKVQEQRRLEEEMRLEGQRMQEQKRLKEQQRLQEEKRLKEQQRLEELRRLEEQQRLEEEKRREEQQRRLEEEKRLQEQQRRLEEEKRLQEQQRRLEEEKRLQEQQRRLEEEKRLQEQQRRLEEEKRREEQQRRLEEEQRLQEQQRRLEEERRREEQQRRLEEEKRLQEQQRRLEEQRKLEEQRQHQEQRRLEEDELIQQRLKEQHRRMQQVLLEQQGVQDQPQENIPQTVTEFNSPREDFAAGDENKVPWIKVTPQQQDLHFPLIQKTDQVKSIQEKYMENMNNSMKKESTLSPHVDAHNRKQQQLAPGVTEGLRNSDHRNFSRTNPTIAAMEIMTRKEMKLNEMEERLAREGKQRKPDKITASMAAAIGQKNKRPAEHTLSVRDSLLKPKGTFHEMRHPQPEPTIVRPIQLKKAEQSKRSGNQPPKKTAAKSLHEAEEETPVILLKKQPKILAPEEIRARKSSSEKKEEAKERSPILVPKVFQPHQQKGKRLVAEVRPQMAEENRIKQDQVRKTAERFEKAARSSRSEVRTNLNRARSKSIGSNLYQKLMELEDERERANESLNQAKAVLPWTGVDKKKPAVLRRRDAWRIKEEDTEVNSGYSLRTSKSSDSITAAKMLAEARMRDQQSSQNQQYNYSPSALRINKDMSKSIEKQIDVYTKTREDIRKILQLAKTCSVTDRIKLFDAQKPLETIDDEERERKAEAIKREIEEAKAQKQHDAEAEKEVEIKLQDPVEAKVKPLKIRMRPKLVRSVTAGEERERAVPGGRLRINQPPGQEHKSEIRSILKKSNIDLTEEDESPEKQQRRLSVENLPSVKSKIETYLRLKPESSSPTELHSSQRPTDARFAVRKARAASLDRNRKHNLPKLLDSHELAGGATFHIYAQSATDYDDDNEEEEDEDEEKSQQRLKVPIEEGLRKSKSFGQFECALTDAAKLDQKHKTVLAFFGEKHNSGKLQKQSDSRRESISDEILGEEDLHDVDAVFESLLNNTFEEKPPPKAAGSGPTRRKIEEERAQQQRGKKILTSPVQSAKASVSDQCAKSEIMASEQEQQKKRSLPRQQTWAGSRGVSPPAGLQSPSPTQSATSTHNDKAPRQSPFAKFRQMEGELNSIGSQQRQPQHQPQPQPQPQHQPLGDTSGRHLTRQTSMPAASMTPMGVLSTLPQQKEEQQQSSSGNVITRTTTVVRSATSAKETILAWVQQTINHYSDVNVTNFSTSWNDGLAFCALIHRFYPEAFDFDKLEAKNRRYNFTLAFKAADEYAGICPLLDVDDMVKMKKPDWKCVFTYVQSFYRRFRNGRDPPQPQKTLLLLNDGKQVIFQEDADPHSSVLRLPPKHEYVLKKADDLVKPFETYKNFSVPPLPTTSFVKSAGQMIPLSNAMNSKIAQGLSFASKSMGRGGKTPVTLGVPARPQHHQGPAHVPPRATNIHYRFSNPNNVFNNYSPRQNLTNKQQPRQMQLIPTPNMYPSPLSFAVPLGSSTSSQQHHINLGSDSGSYDSANSNTLNCREQPQRQQGNVNYDPISCASITSTTNASITSRSPQQNKSSANEQQPKSPPQSPTYRSSQIPALPNLPNLPQALHLPLGPPISLPLELEGSAHKRQGVPSPPGNTEQRNHRGQVHSAPVTPQVEALKQSLATPPPSPITAAEAPKFSLQHLESARSNPAATPPPSPQGREPKSAPVLTNDYTPTRENHTSPKMPHSRSTPLMNKRSKRPPMATPPPSPTTPTKLPKTPFPPPLGSHLCSAANHPFLLIRRSATPPTNDKELSMHTHIKRQMSLPPMPRTAPPPPPPLT